MKEINTLQDVGTDIIRYKKNPIPIQAAVLKEDCVVKTTQGWVGGRKGDFVIEGIEGEIYPCNKAIFKKTYDKL